MALSILDELILLLGIISISVIAGYIAFRELPNEDDFEMKSSYADPDGQSQCGHVH
jgi:hypothetical protein